MFSCNNNATVTMADFKATSDTHAFTSIYGSVSVVYLTQFRSILIQNLLYIYERVNWFYQGKKKVMDLCHKRHKYICKVYSLLCKVNSVSTSESWVKWS